MNKIPFIIAIDFDAVVSTYSGFKGKGVFGHPIVDAVSSLTWLKKTGYQIIINTTRAETWLVEEYLRANNIPFDYINFSPRNLSQHLSPSKVSADVYVDDRALKFEGNWQKTLQDIITFKVWWKK